jgi:hypothetical protein
MWGFDCTLCMHEKVYVCVNLRLNIVLCHSRVSERVGQGKRSDARTPYEKHGERERETTSVLSCLYICIYKYCVRLAMSDIYAMSVCMHMCTTTTA